MGRACGSLDRWAVLWRNGSSKLNQRKNSDSGSQCGSKSTKTQTRTHSVHMYIISFDSIRFDFPLQLAKISREDFNKIIMQLEKNRLDSEISFLKTIYQGLSFLSRKDAMAQLFSFRRRELPRGVVLATAGSPAKEIIIIREGSVLLVDTQTDAERPGKR